MRKGALLLISSIDPQMYLRTMDALTKKMDVDVCFVLNIRVMMGHATNVLSCSAHEMRLLSKNSEMFLQGASLICCACFLI